MKTFITFADYLNAVETSCPDGNADTFPEHQAGIWLAEGRFKVLGKLPSRKNYGAFWDGYDSSMTAKEMIKKIR